MNSVNVATPSVDIGRVLDDGPFTRFQQFVVAFAALTVIVDGFDSQLIGFAIPIIAKQWGVARAAFAPVVASGLLGMGIGSACAGLVADRFGRRVALVSSVFLFSIATCTVGFSWNPVSIAIFRFFAGLGIGGALPTATTLAAEFTPKRRRTIAVTATIVCVPLGGMFAGLFAGYVLPRFGWQPFFSVGGALSLVFALVLLAALPESPRFLARRRERWPELSSLLARFMGTPVTGTVYIDSAEQTSQSRRGFRALLEPEFRRDSIALWCGFFMCMLTIYSAFSWLPTMLVSVGLPSYVATSGLTAYNIGGVVGALLCAIAIARYGSRGPLLASCIAGAASAFAMTRLSFNEHTWLLILGLGIHGLFVNAVQSTMYALCAFVYPTMVRATGTATAAAFGRIGALLSSFVGAIAISRGGAGGYLTALGSAMIFVLVALASVRHHIRPTTPASRT
jgi:AAHS family 4-hydroxybenzoate transporter-like MFS transporter